MTTKTLSPNTVKMMSKTEAEEACKNINLKMSSAGAILLDYHNRDGWRAQGYSSFKDACVKEFAEHYGGRSQVYRLLRQETVAANLDLPHGARPPIVVTEELGKLETPQQQQEAFVEAGGSEATEETTKGAVQAVQAKAPKKKKSDSDKIEKRYQDALERIAKVISKGVRKDIENGILDNVPKREAIYWADLADDAMADIEVLVVSKRWLPSIAWKAKNKIITADSKIVDMLNQAMGEEGEKWEGDIEGFHIVVTRSTRRRR